METYLHLAKNGTGHINTWRESKMKQRSYPYRSGIFKLMEKQWLLLLWQHSRLVEWSVRSSPAHKKHCLAPWSLSDEGFIGVWGQCCCFLSSNDTNLFISSTSITVHRTHHNPPRWRRIQHRTLFFLFSFFLFYSHQLFILTNNCKLLMSDVKQESVS